MYELIKKKNWGLRILIGIVVLFLLTQTLKYFLREPRLTIDGELIKAANEINKHAPIVIDSLITFTNVNAFQGHLFQYNYTINADKSSIDTTELIKLTKLNLLDLVKKNPKATYFKDNSVIVQANYSDSNGTYVCKINLLPSEY